MTLAIMGIGIPGSGKTTALAELAREHNLAYVSKDAIREELLGSVEDQSKNREIWLESNRRIEGALAQGQGIVLDSTHAESWKRKELVRFLRDRGATRVIGAYFDVPFALAEERNRARSRVVSDAHMRWFASQFEKEPPSHDEGFDALYTSERMGDLVRELEA